MKYSTDISSTPPAIIETSAQASLAKVAGVLVLGMTAVSFASIFIRWTEAPALTIAFYRLLFASAFFWITHGRLVVQHLRHNSLTVLGYCALSGAALAVHFAAWITSLSMTSVSSSVVLVSTTPIWVVVGSRFVFREPVRITFIVALLIAVSGAVFIAGSDASSVGRESAVGDLLALIGAIAGAAYFLIGRRVQRKLDTWAYVTATYTSAASVLGIWAFVAGVPFGGFAAKTYGMFVLIALVPQVIGHTSFNWSLKHLTAGMVSVTLLGEPVGATLLAFFLLDEQLGWQKVCAGVLTLAGVVLAGASQRFGKRESYIRNGFDKQEENKG